MMDSLVKLSCVSGKLAEHQPRNQTNPQAHISLWPMCLALSRSDRFPAVLARVGPVATVHLIVGGSNTMSEPRNALWER